MIMIYTACLTVLTVPLNATVCPQFATYCIYLGGERATPREDGPVPRGPLHQWDAQEGPCTQGKNQD